MTKSRLNAPLNESLIRLNSGGKRMSGIEPARDEFTWKGVWCKLSWSVSKERPLLE